MKSNYKEIKSFVELGLHLGCDKIIFIKIAGYADVRENINFTKNKKIFKEVAEILTDPIFDRSEVDTSLIDAYRKYKDKKIFITDRIITKCMEWIFYIPLKLFLSFNRYFPALPYLYEFMTRIKSNHKKITESL